DNTNSNSNANNSNTNDNNDTPTFTIGGTVSGLSGSVTLNNGTETVTVNANGGFTFPTAQPNGTVYTVTVSTQPAGQTCSVSNGAGTLSDANVTNVSVTCAASAFTVGVTVSGFTGNFTLQNNGDDDLAVDGNGDFTFATPVADGAGYVVTVSTQPSVGTCSVTSGSSGTIMGANVTGIAVVCASNAFSVGGSVSGLSGAGLVLQNNGGDNLAISVDGSFSFVTPVADGAGYNVTVATQPAAQLCTVTNGVGTATAVVDNVMVTCEDLFANVTAVSAGAEHSLMLRADGTVWSIGSNSDGQLGNGTFMSADRPVQVCAVGASAPCSTFLTGITEIEAGNDQSFAIGPGGALFAWGRNSNGQLGDGTVGTDRPVPVQVCAQGEDAPCSNFAAGIAQVSAGNVHTLALNTGGGVLGWGDNSQRQLGDETTNQRLSPVFACTDAISGGCPTLLGGVSAVSAGHAGFSSFAIRSGEVLAWGGNMNGELGVGDMVARDNPTPVCADAMCNASVTGASAIDSGGRVTLALVSGSIFGWGVNTDGRLGNNASSGNFTNAVEACGNPSTCDTGLTMASMPSTSTSRFFSLVVQSDGSLLVAGEGNYLAQGEGTPAASSVFIPVCAGRDCSSNLTDVAEADAGGNHAIVLLNDGTVRGWGDNNSGVLGTDEGDVFNFVEFVVQMLAE
ncbi:MAG: hypothetical protein AAF658_08060, partial [Myxococcota bacterium]